MGKMLKLDKVRVNLASISIEKGFYANAFESKKF